MNFNPNATSVRRCAESDALLSTIYQCEAILGEPMSLFADGQRSHDVANEERTAAEQELLAYKYDPSDVHHVTYEFNPTLIPEPVALAAHIDDVTATLSECFGIERAAVRIKQNRKAEDMDVHVMKGSGNSQDYDRKLTAMKQVLPFWRAAIGQPLPAVPVPGLVLERRVATVGASREVLLVVIKPRQIDGGANVQF